MSNQDTNDPKKAPWPVRLIRGLGKNDPGADEVDVETLKSKLPPLDPAKLSAMVKGGREEGRPSDVDERAEAQAGVPEGDSVPDERLPGAAVSESPAEGEPPEDEDVQALPREDAGTHAPEAASQEALATDSDADIVWDEEEVLASAPKFTPEPPPPPPVTVTPEPPPPSPAPAAPNDTYWSALEKFGEAQPAGDQTAPARTGDEKPKPARRRRRSRRGGDKPAAEVETAVSQPAAEAETVAAPVEDRDRPARRAESSAAKRRRAVDVPKPIEDADEDYFGAGVLDEVDVFSAKPEGAAEEEVCEAAVEPGQPEPAEPAAAVPDTETAEVGGRRRRRRRRRRKQTAEQASGASGETASVATAEADPAEEDSGDAAARYADVVT
ncbi:MAG: hypothetical protein D6725_15620, partial [Planctomycetota bacterium]